MIEFTKLIIGKLGKAIADILYNFISLNFKKEIEIIKGNIIKTITKERISLKCA